MNRFNLVKPIHEEIIATYLQNISVGFNLGVTVNTGLFIGPEIVIPFTALYDVVPADLLVTDSFGIVVTVVTP